MYFYNGSVYVEDEDQCISCANFARGVACPLLQALGMGLVVMQDNMVVTNCGFYKEFRRHLKLIQNNNNSPPEDNDDESSDNKLRRFK
jgi:hypothetical protein